MVQTWPEGARIVIDCSFLLIDQQSNACTKINASGIAVVFNLIYQLMAPFCHALCHADMTCTEDTLSLHYLLFKVIDF